MKKILVTLLAFALFSCNKKEVLLPEIDTTIVEKVENLSPIYIFFEVKGKDTIAELNRKNAISSTNFIFNIDKRLALKLVLPEVIKAVAKKEASAHKDSTSQNYYSYSNIKKKQLAFVPFTKMNYKLEKPKSGVNIYFSKGKIMVDTMEFEKEKFENYIENLSVEDLYKCNFCFDKNDSYENYIQNLVLIESLDIKRTHTEEYIY
jgi:hypothetical protein